MEFLWRMTTVDLRLLLQYFSNIWDHNNIRLFKGSSFGMYRCERVGQATAEMGNLRLLHSGAPDALASSEMSISEVTNTVFGTFTRVCFPSCFGRQQSFYAPQYPRRFGIIFGGVIYLDSRYVNKRIDKFSHTAIFSVI